MGLAVLSDGRLVSDSADKSIRIWNITSGQKLRNLTGHTDYVYSLTELSSKKKALKIRIWDI